MRDRRGDEPEGGRRGLAWWFDRRAGTVGMLIAAVLLTQAGLVYVAVDQIGSSDEPMVIQPAQSFQSPRSPLSVEADPPHRVPAPAATRVTETVEAEMPEVTGVDLAVERAQPQGAAPPLTGDGPPSSDVRPEPGDATPGDTPADDGTTDRGSERAEPSETASDASDPHEHQDGSSEPTAEDQDTRHGRHGHGVHDHEPPGQDGDAPGTSGGSRGRGNGGS